MALDVLVPAVSVVPVALAEHHADADVSQAVVASSAGDLDELIRRDSMQRAEAGARVSTVMLEDHKVSGSSFCCSFLALRS